MDKAIQTTGRYSWEKKVEAASKYMQLGNMRLVSELIEVPYQTIADWRKTDWWKDLCDELKTAKKAKQSQKLSEVVDLSVEIVLDRLQNGDYILNNKTGEVMRKPVSLKDAAQVTNNLVTRQIQMEELAEKVGNKRETVQEVLKSLGDEFKKWNRIQNNQTAVDAVIIQES